MSSKCYTRISCYSLPPTSKAHDLEPSFQQTDDFVSLKSLECYQDRFPCPTLSNVPTIILTIYIKSIYLQNEKLFHHLVQLTRFHKLFALYLFVSFAEQKEVKSCVPIKIRNCFSYRVDFERVWILIYVISTEYIRSL